MTEIVVKQFVQDYCSHPAQRGDNIFMDCPKCGKTRSHCNISIATGEFHCYRCGWGGDFDKFVKFFKGRNTSVSALTEEYSSSISLATLIDIYRQDDVAEEVTFDWLTNTEVLTHPKLKCKLAREYLESRSVTISLAESLQLRVGVGGRYDNMMIIPIIRKGIVVNFVARRFQGTGKRYDGPHNEEVLVRRSHLLYNYDNLLHSDYIILVEGIFDTISLTQRDLPVAGLMGKEISSEQIKMVMKWKKVVVLLDGGFTRDALKVAHSLEGLTETIQVAIMPEGTDPSDSPDLALKAIEEARDLSCF